MNEPLVSIISLCYNQAQFCINTLDSIYNQTYKNIELVLIDDCSIDNSVQCIKEWLAKHKSFNCVFIAHEKNKGICKSLNEALSHCKGEYICMIACDDIMFSDKTEHQVKLMMTLPDNYKVLYSDAELIDENGNLLPGKFISTHRDFDEVPSGNIFNQLFAGNFIPAMSTMVRKNVFDAVGTYDENLIYEDYDMWLRIAYKYLFYFDSKISCQYRIHKHSLIRTINIRDHDTMLKIMAKYLGVSEAFDDKITSEIIRRSDIMFVNDAKNWQFWIKKRFKYDKSFLSFKFYVAAILNIKYKRLKRLNFLNKSN